MLTDYKKSFLGLSWMFILPLISVFLWIGLNSAGIIQPGKTGIPYPAYVLVSTSIWNFFHEMYKSSSQVIVSNAKILLLKDFPVLILVAKQIIVNLIRFSIILAVNIIVLYLFGVKFTWVSLLFPLSLMPMVLLAVGIGLTVAIFRVILIDLSTLIDEFMKLLMFLTPVIYAPRTSWDILQKIVNWNPMTYLLGTSRDILVNGDLDQIKDYFLVTLFSVGVFFIGFLFFKMAYKRVLERLTV
jgi:lipopolysaccharide transport system permease protein